MNPYVAPVVPTFGFSGLPSSETPGLTVPASTITASPSSSAAWPITITLGFVPNAAGVSANYIDPAVQFIDSSGNKLGTTYNVTLPALTNSVPLPQIAAGTVAGDVSLTLTVTGQIGATTSFTVPASGAHYHSRQRASHEHHIDWIRC